MGVTSGSGHKHSFWDLGRWDSKQKRFIQQTDTKLLSDLKIELEKGHYQNYGIDEIKRELHNKVETIFTNLNQNFLVGYLGLKKDQIVDIKASLVENLLIEWQKRNITINQSQGVTFSQSSDNTEQLSQILSANSYEPKIEQTLPFGPIVDTEHTIVSGKDESQVIENEFSGPPTYDEQSSNSGQVIESQVPENDGQQVEQAETVYSNVGSQLVSYIPNTINFITFYLMSS